MTLALTDPPLSSTETAKFYLNNKHVGDVSPFSDMTTFSHVITAADIAALPTPTGLAYWTRQKTGIDKNVIKSIQNCTSQWQENRFDSADHPDPQPFKGSDGLLRNEQCR